MLKNDPYKGERFSRGKHAIRKYLTAEELKKVKDAQIDSETICRVRDLFIFQAYTGISNITYLLPRFCTSRLKLNLARSA